MQYGGQGYGQPQTRSKVVFVGNLPFDYTEEQFVEVFSSVGPVVSFRLVFDHNTGKPKGFGFCEYRDADTAASALRNLQGVEIGGRGLRLDFADTDDAPPSKRFGGGAGGPPRGPPMGGYGGAYGGGGGGGAAPGGYGAPPPGQYGAPPPAAGAPGAYGAPPPAAGGVGGGGGGGTPLGAGGYGMPPAAGAAVGAVPVTGPPRPLPAGTPLEAGKNATDKISETIGTMAPGQLLDVMSQMKALVTASPYEARALLQSNPQLSYALFQAMLCMNIVDPAILQKAFPGAVPAGSVPPPSAAPAPSSYPPAPASYGGAPPPPSSSYNTPPHHQPASYNGPASYTRPSQPPAQQPLSYNGRGSQQQQQAASYNGPSSATPAHANAPAPAAATAAPSADQATLIQQVLSMTDAQIAALDENSRNTILQIRQQAQRAMGR
ncbi:hypothetical protein JCM8547_002593 [Rhodosporidiobolus lusitaniae]